MPNIPQIKIGGTIYNVKDAALHDAINRTAHANNKAWVCQWSGSGSSATQTVKDNGIVDYSYTAPSGISYVYIYTILGTYDDIKDTPFAFRIRNAEDDAQAFSIHVSTGTSWAPVYSPITVAIEKAINSKEAYADTFILSDIVTDESAYTGKTVYFLVESKSRSNAQKTVQISLIANATNATNATNAITALQSYNAGGFVLDEKIQPATGIVGTATQGSGAWSTKGKKHVLTFDDNLLCPESLYYGWISWDIKSLFGQGITLKIKISKANSYYWRFSEWKLSQYPNQWGPTLKIKDLDPSDYGGSITDLESEFEIDIDNAFSDVDYAEYDNVYFVVASLTSGLTRGYPGNVLSIEVNAHPIAQGVIAADDLKGFNKTNYYTKDEVDDLIGTETYDVDLLFWGDSLTAGAGGNGTTYPAVCAAELGKTHRNCGVGGETANTISARQGGNAIIIPAGNINGEYAYNALIDMFGDSVKPLRQGNGSSSGNVLYIDGKACSLTITQSSATSTDAIYTISGYTGGPSNIPKLARFAGSAFTGEVVIIWVGQNGSAVGSDTSVTARMTIIDSMIAHIQHKRYVILGLSSGTESEKASEDAAMLMKYGNNFFPTRKLLVNYGLTINGLEPTSQDETDIAAGTVPTSLRSDHVHMNAYGYTAIGKLLADKIKSLGWAN